MAPPFVPVSRNPAVMMTMCFVPSLPNSSTMSRTSRVGTTSTARSGTTGRSAMALYAFFPSTVASFGWMGKTSPG